MLSCPSRHQHGSETSSYTHATLRFGTTFSRTSRPIKNPRTVMNERQWRNGAVKRLTGVYEDIALARSRNAEMLADVSRALRDGVHALNPTARRFSSTSTWSSRQSSLNSQPAHEPCVEHPAAPSDYPAEDVSSSKATVPSSSTPVCEMATGASLENNFHDSLKQAGPQATLNSKHERSYTLPPLIPLSPLKPVTLEDSTSPSIPLTITTSMNKAQSLPPTPPDTPTRRKIGTHFAHHNLPDLAMTPFIFPIMTELSLPEMGMEQTNVATKGSPIEQSNSKISPRKRSLSLSPPPTKLVDMDSKQTEVAEAIEGGVELNQEEGRLSESMGVEADSELRVAKRRSPSPKKTTTFEQPSTQLRLETESAEEPEPEQGGRDIFECSGRRSPSKRGPVPTITLRDFDDLDSSSREVSLGSIASTGSTNPSSLGHGDITNDPSKTSSCHADEHEEVRCREEDEESAKVEAWLLPLREAALEALEEDTATLVDALRSFVNGLKELGSDLAALRFDTQKEHSPRKRRSTDSKIGSFNPATPYNMCDYVSDTFHPRTDMHPEAQALCVKAREQLWDMKAMISALKTPRQEALLLSQAGPGLTDWNQLGAAQRVSFLLDQIRTNGQGVMSDHNFEGDSMESQSATRQMLAAVVEEAANVEFLGKVRGWEKGVEKLESEFGGLFA